MDRKEFIKTGGRLLILGGIAFSTGYLIAERKIDTTCSYSSSCKTCGKFSGCTLPQAEEVKDGPK